MSPMDDPLDAVVEHYESSREEDRLAIGLGQLELLRTQEILLRYLPPAPASVLDVGGATGVHARWLAEMGYAIHIVDVTPRHVAAAQAELGALGVTAEVGDARQLPAVDASHDVVLLLGPLYHLQSRDDRLTALREARRVVRPGGELVFLGNGTILMLCVPDEDGVPAENWMRRPYFGMHRFEWPDDPGVEFHLGYGDWIRLLRANGFIVEDLVELRPAADATTRYEFVTVEWARQWPCEEIWRARKA
jgi:SAM-dependent methyltransferase